MNKHWLSATCAVLTAGDGLANTTPSADNGSHKLTLERLLDTTDPAPGSADELIAVPSAQLSNLFEHLRHIDGLLAPSRTFLVVSR